MRGLDPDELVLPEAGVALTAVGVEDPQLCPPPRRAEAVAGDHRLGELTDDIAAEAEPASPLELQAQAGRFGHGRTKIDRQNRRLEQDEHALGTPGEGRQAMEPITDPWRPRWWSRRPSRRQVDNEHVDCPAAEQRAGD